MNNLIDRNLMILGGSPTIKGRRLSVYNLISGLYDSDNLVTCLKDFEINLETVCQAIDYCSKLKCTDKPDLDFCEGCQLFSLVENDNSKNIEEFKNHLVIDEGEYFIGSVEEYKESIYGRKGWKMARELRGKSCCAIISRDFKKQE